MNRETAAFFGDKICKLDCAMLGLGDVPSSRDQQALEALAVLVALREWVPYWRNKRVQMAVQTDNIAALTMLCKLQPRSQNLGLIAREIALDVAASSYSPDDIKHIPGVANKAADYLSRIYEPNSAPNSCPPYLPPSLWHKCSPRSERWWRTVSGPARNNG